MSRAMETFNVGEYTVEYRFIESANVWYFRIVRDQKVVQPFKLFDDEYPSRGVSEKIVELYLAQA